MAAKSVRAPVTALFGAMDTDGDGVISQEEFRIMNEAWQSRRVHKGYVPKRAAQHSLCVPSGEEPPVALKPGQVASHREGFYCTEARPNKETYIEQDRFGTSEYDGSIANLTLPADYTEMRVPVRPRSTGGEGGSTAHWTSEYKFANTSCESWGPVMYNRTRHPPYIVDTDPRMSWSRADTSSYREEYGRYGSNPRDLVKVGAKALPILKNALHEGTAKSTNHIPGYQGFLPSCPTTGVPDSARPISSARGVGGFSERTVDKSNPIETYHTNLVGYAGHVPQTCRNARGGRRPTERTMNGRDFRDPALFEKH